MTAKGEKLTTHEARIHELEVALARSDRTVQALRDVGLALGSTLDLDHLLELILSKITELLEADRSTLYLLDEHRGRLFSRLMVGSEARSIELPLGEGIAGYVAKTGRTVRVKDAYTDKRFLRLWDDLTGYRTRSILAAPMKNHAGRIIGVIQVLNKAHGEGEFSKHDEELLGALSMQAAISIDNSRLFLSVIQKNAQLVETKDQLEHRVADLKLLFELETAMSVATSMEDLARAVITEAARACEATRGALLVDENESGVWLYTIDPDAPPESKDGSNGAHGGPPRGRRPSRPPPPRTVAIKRTLSKHPSGIIGWTMANNTAASLPQDAPRIGLNGGASSDADADASPDVVSAIAVPLDGETDASIGSIALYDSKKLRGFSQDDRALLRLISANASTAVRLLRTRLERERSERLSTIGRLLSGVMHDMRTPLTIISGYVQLMASASDPAQRAEHAKLILKQFDLIRAMQREVLEFARGERSILVRKVYLARFFEDIEKQLRHELEPSNVVLSVVLGDRGTARFDEAKMTRALHNLTRNAVEAIGPNGGTITLTVERDHDTLVVSVRDTGKGIPAEIKDKLFQSFVTAGKRGGTGLGLPIVKKIVDEHQGTISVASSPHGATFTIRLPIEGPTTPHAERAEKGHPSA